MKFFCFYSAGYFRVIEADHREDARRICVILDLGRPAGSIIQLESIEPFELKLAPSTYYCTKHGFFARADDPAHAEDLLAIQ